MAHYKYGETIDLHVGGYLKHELQRIGKKQEVFAEEFGTSPRNARRWMSKGVTNVITICEIADYLGVSVRDILSEEDDVPSPDLIPANRIKWEKSGRPFCDLPDFFVFCYSTACPREGVYAGRLSCEWSFCYALYSKPYRY